MGAKDKKGHLSRRKLFRAAGAAGVLSAMDPLDIIASLLWEKTKGNTAQAQTAAHSHRYISILQAGSPPRWVYDLLLNPTKSADFMANPQMGTRYIADNGVYKEVEYFLEKFGNVWLPPLWGFDLPTSDGKTKKLSSLLPNLLHMRGIDTNNAGHDFSRRLHFMTPSATFSTTALTADRGDAPIPAIAMRVPDYIFKSTASKSAVRLGASTNYITDLLNPFTQPTGMAATFTANMTKAKDKIASAQAAIDSDIGGGKAEYLPIALTRDNARKLMDRQFPDFTVEWNRLKNKYQDLINGAIRATYPGINDKPIGTSTTRDKTYDINERICDIPDLRNLVQTTTNVANLADSFALIDFVARYDLSRSIVVNHGGLINLNNPGATNATFDEHFCGKIPTLLINTLVFAAVGSCLMELIEVLKTAGIYDKTVIDVAGEFNRMPRIDSTGSDHGFRGASVALYSGSVTSGPYILGNIRSDASGPAGARYAGSWGYGDRVEAVGNVPLSKSHFAATLATMLNAPSPVTAVSSLVEVKNGEIVPLASHAAGVIIKR